MNTGFLVSLDYVLQVVQITLVDYISLIVVKAFMTPCAYLEVFLVVSFILLRGFHPVAGEVLLLFLCPVRTLVF